MTLEVIEYAASVLICYFAGRSGKDLIRPMSVSVGVAVHFCLMQFKALQELGLDVPTEILRTFFPAELVRDLKDFPPVLRAGDEITRLFIDFQGSVEKPQELAAIVAKGIHVTGFIHMTGANRSPNHAEKQLIKYVHGLLKCPRRGVGRAQMIVNLRTFVQAHLPTEIVILRKETRKFVPSFRNLVRLVELRKWKHQLLGRCLSWPSICCF